MAISRFNEYNFESLNNIKIVNDDITKYNKKKNMSRKRKELPILENVTIADIAGEGKAITFKKNY